MSEAFLELRSIAKTYPGVIALDGVSLSLAHGEVLGLIGENGAGKSTMMKVLGGVIAPSSGTVVIDGVEHARLTVTQATTAGIAFVHQELNLFENLDVAQNVFIGREPGFGGMLKLVDEKTMHARVRPLLGRLGVDFEPTDMVENLSIAQRQMVEIAKALSLDARVIIMDEPTSSLTLTETDRLLEVIDDLQRHGVSTIYISHRLGEVKTCCDRVVVLRDGRAVGELAKNELTHAAMARMMIGRDLKSLYIPPKAPPKATGLLVTDLVTDAFPDRAVTLSVRFGEILGLAGLIGSGRSTLAQTVFGVQPPLSGSISLDGAPVSVKSPRDAISKGVYLIPEDRKRTGLVLDMPIVENISLADLKRYSRAMLIVGGREQKVAEEQRQSLKIKTPSIETETITLSGGNQQKVVLGKWLSMRPKVIMLDEPTRGIDVGAKAEIYEIMRTLADSGVAILMISSDMEEVIGVSDRIAVMHEGRVSGFLEREDFSEHNVLMLAVGQKIHEDAVAHA
ncbi:MAG TPA: sugar ABC transporter ATP-binding protein [Roseiarcus sp.]|jgi:ribose transport system ATP-binding protein